MNCSNPFNTGVEQALDLCPLFMLMKNAAKKIAWSDVNDKDLMLAPSLRRQIKEKQIHLKQGKLRQLIHFLCAQKATLPDMCIPSNLTRGWLRNYDITPTSVEPNNYGKVKHTSTRACAYIAAVLDGARVLYGKGHVP